MKKLMMLVLLLGGSLYANSPREFIEEMCFNQWESTVDGLDVSQEALDGFTQLRPHAIGNPTALKLIDAQILFIKNNLKYIHTVMDVCAPIRADRR